MPSVLNRIFLFLYILFSYNQFLSAQNFLSSEPFQDHFFIENKGQFKEFNAKNVLFELTDKNDKIYILEDGFLWVKSKRVVINDSSQIQVSYIQNQFIGCNSRAKILKSGQTQHYFTYGNSSSKSYGFEQVILENFYPNIDLIYALGNPGDGIKYSFRIRSGGNPQKIRFKYTSPHELNYSIAETSIEVSNSDFSLRESGLKVVNRGRLMVANYRILDGVLGFNMPDFKMGMEILIDPWVKSFNNLNRTSNLYSGSLGENIGFDVDFDSKGNVFVFGGCPLGGNQSKLAKYDQSGSLKWVFQGVAFIPVHMIMWYSTAGFEFMGSFIVDRTNDKVYLSDAWGMPKIGNLIIRLDSSGNSDSFLIHHPGLTTANKFVFRCDPHRVVAFGGFNHSNRWSNLFEILDTNIYKPKAFIPKRKNGQYDLIMDATTDDSNNVYVLIKGFSPPFSVYNNSNNVDVLAKLTDSLNSTVWYDTLITKLDQYCLKPYVPTTTLSKISIGNSTNSIVATKNYIYYYDGKFIAAYNKSNGSLQKLDSLPGEKQSFQQGIIADNCGNVIVGADSGRLKVFKFDGSSFSWVKNVVVFPNSPRCVLDLVYDKERNLLVFSGDSMVGTIINPVDCESSKTTEFYVYPQKRCSNFAFAQVKYPDTTKSYTFTWFDSTTNKVIRKISKFKQYRDTFYGRNPEHNYLVSIKQEDGCYSMVSNFWLSAIPKYDTSIKVTRCKGDDFLHRGKNYSSDTQFVDTFITYFGCDSFVRYKLIFNPHSSTVQSKTICRGDTIWVGKSNYTIPGNYRDTLLNYLGCDSVIQTELKVLFDSVVQFKRVCDGGGFAIGKKIYDKSGIYLDTFQNYWGCDSVVTTHLIVSRDTTIGFSLQICAGDSAKIGNAYYSKTGRYIDSFLRITGCDSVVVTDLLVNSDTLIRNKVSICEGDTFKVAGNNYTKSDVYNDTLLRYTGCDSVIITELQVFSTQSKVNEILLCSKDSIKIDGQFYSSSGEFKRVYTNSNGCDSTVTYIINKRNLLADFEIDSLQNPAFQFRNLSSENVKYYWDFGDFSVDSVNRNTSHRYENDQSYSVNVCLTIVDSFGCSDTICKRVNISKLLYYLFNTFTPGNDGKNDVFRIKYLGGTFNYNLMIYNRWGAMVYETINANVSDESQFWNGKVMNTDIECPSGSYFVFYQLYLDGPQNPPKEIHGVITLIR
jgi:gliding motility-associated-like protein